MPQITINVHRLTPKSDQKSSFETHVVEISEMASIPDALFALQRDATPDLAFRFSCRVGMCGSCATVVNRCEQLACSTLVKDVGPCFHATRNICR
ncbi:MAG: 2Fe-2S iron-sulfur cluster-binding protein [Verrucomicrobiota bacterium]